MSKDFEKEFMDRMDAAKAAVRAQADFLHAEFGRVKSEWKHDGTRVTAADLAISEGIFAELKKKFPEDDFCSEESAESVGTVKLTARFAWVLDPIDGTNNYALGIPHCAISLALLEDGEPVFGVVYDMARRMLMWGGPETGAFEEGRQLVVKDGGLSAQSLVGFHSPFDKKFSGDAAVLVERFKIRGLGTSTMHLAYVAAGLFDATVDHNVKVWDIAAAAALCLGAGGELHFMGPSPFPMREFSVKLPRLQYYAGSAAACRELGGLLGKWETG